METINFKIFLSIFFIYLDSLSFERTRFRILKILTNPRLCFSSQPHKRQRWCRSPNLTSQKVQFYTNILYYFRKYINSLKKINENKILLCFHICIKTIGIICIKRRLLFYQEIAVVFVEVQFVIQPIRSQTTKVIFYNNKHLMKINPISHVFVENK